MEIPFCLLLVLVVVFLVGLLVRRTRRFCAWAVLIVGVAELAIFMMAPQFPRRLATGLSTNIAMTSDQAEFPELRTRVYPAEEKRVAAAVTEIIQTLPSWKFVGVEPEGTLHAEKKVAVFTDDVTVRLFAQGPNSTRVEVTSQSRVGRGDFGENRRHIAQLFWNLDRKL